MTAAGAASDASVHHRRSVSSPERPISRPPAIMRKLPARASKKRRVAVFGMSMGGFKAPIAPKLTHQGRSESITSASRSPENAPPDGSRHDLAEHGAKRGPVVNEALDAASGPPRVPEGG